MLEQFEVTLPEGSTPEYVERITAIYDVNPALADDSRHNDLHDVLSALDEVAPRVLRNPVIAASFLQIVFEYAPPGQHYGPGLLAALQRAAQLERTTYGLNFKEDDDAEG